MLQCCYRASIDVTATGASAISVDYLVRGDGINGSSLFAFVARTGSFLDHPLTAVNFGASAGAFLASQTSSGNNMTIECWIYDNPVVDGTVAATVIAGCASGTTIPMHLVVIENNGYSLGGPTNTPGAAAAVSPASITATALSTNEGRKTTISSPTSNHLYIGMASMFTNSTARTWTLVSGTAAVDTTDTGSPPNRITCVAGYASGAPVEPLLGNVFVSAVGSTNVTATGGLLTFTVGNRFDCSLYPTGTTITAIPDDTHLGVSNAATTSGVQNCFTYDPASSLTALIYSQSGDEEWCMLAIECPGRALDGAMVMSAPDVQPKTYNGI